MPVAVIGAVVAVGASAAASVGIISMTTAMVIGTLATVAGSFLSKPSIPSIGAYTPQSDRKQVLRAAAASCQYIYGTTMTSGVLFFAEEEAGDQKDGEWVHMAIAIAGHPIDGISKVILGDEDISTYGVHASWELHNDRQTADPFMLANTGSWKPDMIGKGIAWVRLSLKFDMDLFPSGIPNVKFLVRGRKVYDPRTKATVFSNNAALVIRDFYLSNIVKVPATDVDEESFILAANICDERVNDANGVSYRYTIDGCFDADESLSGVLDDMHQACGGEPTYVGGKHGILVGAYYGPATMTLTDDDILEDVKIVPETPYKDKVNIMTGTFVDAKADYTEADFPAIRMQDWIDEDGAEFTQDLKLRFVTNEFTAQRLGQMVLNRKKLGRTIELTANYKAYAMRCGYYVKLTIESLGIINQEFRITKWELSTEAGVNLTLRQETPAVWNDAVGKPIDRGNITDIPTAAIAPPQGLVFILSEVGEVVQGRLEWTVSDKAAYSQVQVFDDSGKLVYNIQVPGTNTTLNGLVRGRYRATVVAVSYMGVRSAPATVNFDIAAPDAPSAVDVELGYFSLTVIPRSRNQNPVQYDFWTSGKVAIEDLSTENIEASADRLGIGSTWTQNGLDYMATYYYYVRAINIYGSSGFVRVQGTVNTELNDFWEQLDDKWASSNVGQQIMGQIDTNYEALIEMAADQGWAYQYTIKQSEKFTAALLRIDKVIADEVMGVAETVTKLSVRMDDNEAALEQKLTAQFNIDGTGFSSYTLKTGVTYNGQYHSAGMSVYAEVATGGKVTTGVAFIADQFRIMNNIDGVPTAVFYVENGQVYLKDAIASKLRVEWAQIDNVVINSAQIKGDIVSDNFVNNTLGWAMKKNGEIQINGGTIGQGRMKIVNDQILVWDEQGRLRVEIGRLS